MMFEISEDAPYAKLGQKKISDLTVDEFRSVMTEILESHERRKWQKSRGMQPDNHPWENFKVIRKEPS